jgi:hypothetical protein
MKSLEKSIVSVVTPLKLPEGKYHVFLTHDWGEKGVNHRRVSKVNKILKEKYGLTTWFDEDRMDGDVRTTMTKGIENSMCMVIFITNPCAIPIPFINYDWKWKKIRRSPVLFSRQHHLNGMFLHFFNFTFTLYNTFYFSSTS